MEKIRVRGYKRVEEEKGYNGWSNYETWKMNLNLTNDEYLYNSVLSIVNGKGRDYEKAKALKDWVEENFWVDKYSIVHFPGGDSFTSSELGEVDWLEIVKAFRE